MCFQDETKDQTVANSPVSQTHRKIRTENKRLTKLSQNKKKAKTTQMEYGLSNMAADPGGSGADRLAFDN